MNKEEILTDNRDREIKIGDVLLYGYGFYGPPVVGIVTKITKYAITFSYISASYDYEKDIYESIVRSSVCKRPNSALVINPCYKDKEFRKIFKLDMLSHLKINDNYDEIIQKSKCENELENI